MYDLHRNTNDTPCRNGIILETIITLAVLLCVSACATSTSNKDLKPIDRITIGIEGEDMRELWIKANNEGRLPSISQIPIPVSPVSVRHEITVSEVPVSKPVRPVIHDKVVADIQPFSLETLVQYDGDFQIIDNKPGVLIGKIRDIDNPMEFHYKLPITSRVVRLQKDTRLHLSFRDDVQDSALQRRIILSDKRNIAPFVYISEGSNEPYSVVIKVVDVKIEQEQETGNPPVKVTYKGNVVVVKQGERRKIGSGENAVEVYLRSSVAISQKEQVLREGQPFYVNLVIY
jgi:hypothetical protein